MTAELATGKKFSNIAAPGCVPYWFGLARFLFAIQPPTGAGYDVSLTVLRLLGCAGTRIY
jgi:hypothetical protein